MFDRRFKYIHKRDSLVCDSVSNIDNFRVDNKRKFSLSLYCVTIALALPYNIDISISQWDPSIVDYNDVVKGISRRQGMDFN